MPADALRHLFPDRLDGVQRRHRLLEHHADVVAAQFAHPVFIGGQDIDTVEGYAACRTRAVRKQPHHGERRHRFARSGFTDKAHHFARIDREIDIL